MGTEAQWLCQIWQRPSSGQVSAMPKLGSSGHGDARLGNASAGHGSIDAGHESINAWCGRLERRRSRRLIMHSVYKEVERTREEFKRVLFA